MELFEDLDLPWDSLDVFLVLYPWFLQDFNGNLIWKKY